MPANNVNATTGGWMTAAGSTLSVVPAACFTGALLTDLIYVRTFDMQWPNFSIWLITCGLLSGGLAIAVALVAAILGRSRGGRTRWPYLIAAAAVMLLSLLNAFVHSRDAYTSVVPAGLTLSGVVVVLIAVAGGLRRAVPDRTIVRETRR